MIRESVGKIDEELTAGLRVVTHDAEAGLLLDHSNLLGLMENYRLLGRERDRIDKVPRLFKLWTGSKPSPVDSLTPFLASPGGANPPIDALPACRPKATTEHPNSRCLLEKAASTSL